MTPFEICDAYLRTMGDEGCDGVGGWLGSRASSEVGMKIERGSLEGMHRSLG